MDSPATTPLTVDEAKRQLIESATPNGVVGFIKDHPVEVSIAALIAGAVVGVSPPLRRFVMKHALTLFDTLAR